ncbi:hypothetical protein NL676_021539 [Syzygium grande]|nr:hypothetical protein NL676_021539 [Syzygium grande]
MRCDQHVGALGILHLLGSSIASFGSTPIEGKIVEFLHWQKHFKSACESPAQHSLVGGSGFGGAAAGLQAISSE